MKKVFTLLAIASISFSFMSCRQDDVASDMEVGGKISGNSTDKQNRIIVTNDSIKVTTASQNVVDPPKDPPRDTTSW